MEGATHLESAQMTMAPEHQEDSSRDRSTDTSRPEDEGAAETKDVPDAEVREDAATATSGDTWKGEQPPLHLNHDALKHIATYFIPGTRRKCIDITTLQRGTFHEIRELHFSDGSTCIGRFTRDKKEHVSVLESETATVDYVRKHTSIRVPEIYFINCNPQHVVGAAFVLMEKLPGRHLYCFWEKLGLKHKLAVVEAIAGVLAQLMKLEFDSIGSMTAGGEIGPLCDMAYPESEWDRGPFSTTLDYLLSFVKSGMPIELSTAKLYSEVGDTVRWFCRRQKDNPIYGAPFRMIHGDFDAQNMLFEWDGGEDLPRMTGIIDWDYSQSGPLYYLCEYPIFIQDVDFQKEIKFWPQNKILRKYFVQKLAAHFTRGSSARRDVQECFRQKNLTLNAFNAMFIGRHWPSEEEEALALACYLKIHDPETSDHEYAGRAYRGKIFWEEDSEMGSDDEVGEFENEGVGEEYQEPLREYNTESEDGSEGGSEAESEDGTNNRPASEEDDRDVTERFQ
ncbi:unnamed protein product [Zymoseptoria tritici ST99CH_1E4]|uniref:Aminoglycoside phosphotransferase domain-containing protein n=1 Tax=Zymoseptoria tritici ST99CH_1E4 TaxID=1276532 RepID=A0A2H1G409_ZYMTR|nr:unnamed protein product [Zymoseptoria tritici ST99CH_1E4]